MDRTYRIYAGLDGMEILNASIAYQYNPSEENKKRVDKISEKIKRESAKSQKVNEKRFIGRYGKDLLEFIRSISKDNFLLGANAIDYQYWGIKSDDDDDYWVITFNKGHFHYLKEISGGYAGTEILEANISQERVLELLKEKE